MTQQRLTTDRVIDLLSDGTLRSYNRIDQELREERRMMSPVDLGEKMALLLREGRIRIHNDEIRGRLYGLPGEATT